MKEGRTLSSECKSSKKHSLVPACKSIVWHLATSEMENNVVNTSRQLVDLILMVLSSSRSE